MGAGKPGDIAYLCAIARPDVALVNNVGAAHLERMGSLLGVAQTKGAIYQALPADGVAVVNADDAFAMYFRERLRTRRVITFEIESVGCTMYRMPETPLSKPTSSMDTPASPRYAYVSRATFSATI